MNKFFSRKFLICATVEIIITIYLFCTIAYVQNADQTGILREWVHFTIFNVVFYYTANDISKALEIYKIVNVGKKLFSKSETEVNDENNRWE